MQVNISRLVCRLCNTILIQKFQKCDQTEDKIKTFSKKLETSLAEYFPNYDFSGINGHRGEKVGKLKFKNCLFDGDGDHLKN